MTDIVTGNQIDIAAFDSGMSTQKGQTYDPYGPNYVGPSNTGQAKYDLASEAAMLGTTYAAVKNPLRALETIGIASSTEEERARDVQFETASQKLGTMVNPLNRVKNLYQGTRKTINTIGDLLNPQLVPAGGVPNMRINQVDDFNPAQPLMFKKQPRTPETQQLINVNREFKPKGFNTNKWDNYIAKFGSKEGAEAAIKKAEESAAYLKEHGSLKGNKNIWTDPKTGESFLVKNKAKRGEINIGFDNVKMIERTLAKRLEGAKLNTDEIAKIGKDLGWDQKKITKYIETSEQAKRTLESLIKDLNKGEGRTMWSLGHRRAVKTQAHSADRITNIELEPLVDVLTEAGRTIKGNTGRAANDELSDILSKITNNPADLKADMIHWGDDVVGKFMPRMREITDAKSFFEEIVKREDFLAKITKYAKKEGVDLEEAADVVMRPLMDKTKVFEETFFDIRSKGF